MLFGYARISTPSQKFNLQIDALLKAGVKEKNIYTDSISRAKLEIHLTQLGKLFSCFIKIWEV